MVIFVGTGGRIPAMLCAPRFAPKEPRPSSALLEVVLRDTELLRRRVP